ncbi:hypothetical protein Tco_1514098, partial [Tanacetum coccineum]
TEIAKNRKKIFKAGKTRTRERKSTQRAERMLSKVNIGQLKPGLKGACAEAKDLEASLAGYIKPLTFTQMESLFSF